MATVWVLERKAFSDQSLTIRLCANFPVQVFASLNSLKTLNKLKKTVEPDIFIFNSLGFQEEINVIINYCKYKFNQIPCFYLLDINQYSLETNLPPTHSKLLIKKYSNDELIALIKYTLPQNKKNSTIIKYRDIKVDFSELTLTIAPNQNSMALTKKESKLMKSLLKRPGKCINRDNILQEVWDSTVVSSRTVDSHISRLRKHLVNSEVNIKSIYGGGYILS